jgi:beta-glucosidase
MKERNDMKKSNVRKMCLIILPVMVVSLFCLTVFAQTVGSKVDGLLSQMTNQEKYDQLINNSFGTTPTNTRLGIPGFNMSDGPHGVRNSNGVISYPYAMAMAASWDPDLTRRVGEAMGQEFAYCGFNVALGPCTDLISDPRNGRAAEGIGEDPYLGAITTTASMIGFQKYVIGTVKHYDLNARDNGRENINDIVDQRSLIEFYGPGFKRAVQYGGAFAVMGAYNLINGDKCSESQNLNLNMLRTKWGFPFVLMSDWGGIWNAEKAIESTTDLCMGNSVYADNLANLVTSGAVTMSTIDYSVKDVLRTKIASGLMNSRPSVSVDFAVNGALCREAGKKSLVLLKNTNNILPLSTGVTSVAVIGPSADVCQINCFGSSEVNYPTYKITPRQGIINKIGSAKVTYAKGCDINSTDTSGFQTALNLASAAQVVVYVGGLDYTQEGEAYDIGGDRKTGSINLPGQQQNLINQLAGANANLIVVLESGGICGINSCINNIKGLIYGFYPGQEGGNAIADVLFGDYNPSGKLPVTMPKTDSQLPAWDDNHTNDVVNGCGYRWFDSQGTTPEFPFGFGLSYTTFSYSNLVVTPASTTVGQEITVTANMTNTGSRVGEEVAQLYLSTGSISPSVPMPVKQLKGFQKISLNPNETKTVTFKLTPEELYIFDTTSDSYKVPTGSYTVKVGGSSNNLPLTGSFTLTSDTAKPDLILTKVWTVPAAPKVGDQVSFLALIVNRGTGASPAGIIHGISFNIDGTQVCWSGDLTNSIPAGGMAFACSSGSSSGADTWTATAGTHTLTTIVDDINRIAECIETNNQLDTSITVSQGKPVPGKIEAESYDAMSGIQTETCTDTGGGSDVGYIDTGDYMDYFVNVSTTGSYNVEFRVASANGSTGGLQLKSGSTVLCTVNIGNTGGWQSWQTAGATVNLSAGPQTLRVYANNSGWNLNWINFTANVTGTNKALNKPATASSVEKAGVEAAKAVDGDTGSRWSSLFTDPQWIYVDLGSSQSINRVKLNWETAYGKSYKIQVSNDASAWTDVYSTTASDGGIDDITFTATSARYVRMYGTQRNTQWGYSLFEFEVY